MSIMRIVASTLLFCVIESCCSMEMNSAQMAQEDMILAQAQDAGARKKKVSWNTRAQWVSLSGQRGGWVELIEKNNYRPCYDGVDLDFDEDNEDDLAPYEDEIPNAQWSMDVCRDGRGMVALAVVVAMVYTAYW